MCSFTLYSKVILVDIYTLFFHIILHYGLSQDIEYIAPYAIQRDFVHF